jgi:hypothetical protein
MADFIINATGSPLANLNINSINVTNDVVDFVALNKIYRQIDAACRDGLGDIYGCLFALNQDATFVSLNPVYPEGQAVFTTQTVDSYVNLINPGTYHIRYCSALQGASGFSSVNGTYLYVNGVQYEAPQTSFSAAGCVNGGETIITTTVADSTLGLLYNYTGVVTPTSVVGSIPLNANAYRPFAYINNFAMAAYIIIRRVG